MTTEVDRWFKERKPSAEPAMQRVREAILRADPRLTEYVKYGTVQFGFEGDMANFVQHGKKTVTLMFNRGARIKGRFSHLEGVGPSARFMRFADEKEVAARARELTEVARAWCALGPEEKGNKPA
jgi:hypothetical protein